jgi:hypothetical protein
VVHGRHRQIRAPEATTGQPQAFEGLRAGDLVHQVEVDVEQRGRIVDLDADNVRVNDLVDQSLRVRASVS